MNEFLVAGLSIIWVFAVFFLLFLLSYKLADLLTGSPTKYMGRLTSEKNIYRYKLTEKSKVVYWGITYDFSRRGVGHRKDFPGATIKQVGKPITLGEGLKWLRKQNRILSARTADTI